MFQFVHLLLFVTLCHCQDLDAIMAQFNEAATEATGVTQAPDYVVTETLSYETTQAVDAGATEAAPVETASENQVESETESNRRKRQDDAQVETPADTDGDLGGDLEAILVQIFQATQAPDLPSEFATDPVPALESRR